MIWIAPVYYYSPLESSWKAGAVILASAIPLVIMVLAAAPFVTQLHLHLPVWARASPHHLQRFAASLPPSAEFDIKALKWVLPRQARVKASEMYIHQGGVTGAMTLRRQIPAFVNELRSWYDWKPMQKFYVTGKSGTREEQSVWQGVLASMARGWGRPNMRDRVRAQN